MLSNLYSESDLATNSMSLEHMTLLCDFAQTVLMQFQGDNYRETLSEVFFTLSNLITECDPEQL